MYSKLRLLHYLVFELLFDEMVGKIKNV